MYRQLKIWKERIKMNFHGQDVLYVMYYNPIAVLKIDSVYKQSKNYHSQAYVQECRYNGAEIQQQSTLFNSDDDGYFEM